MKIILLITLLVAVSSITKLESELQETNVESVKINDVEWMSTDLNVSAFRDGDTIPEAKTKDQWVAYATAGKPAYCYYDFNDTVRKYKGKLYNWFAVNDPRGLAPIGWHVASLEEWMAMIEFLGGETIAGLQLKSAEGWKKYGSGNNNTGFSAFPGGFCTKFGYCNSLDNYVGWWTSSETDTEKAWSIYMIVEERDINNADIYRYNMEKEVGFYVRCIKDK